MFSTLDPINKQSFPTMTIITKTGSCYPVFYKTITFLLKPVVATLYSNPFTFLIYICIILIWKCFNSTLRVCNEKYISVLQ